jgi:hypothetical protein
MNDLIDGKKEGFWEMWLDDDVIDFRGYYIDDKEEGYLSIQSKGRRLTMNFGITKII